MTELIKASRTSQSKTRKVWKLVLTGGPCGGKTTGQARLCTFFENLGWKVRGPLLANFLDSLLIYNMM